MDAQLWECLETEVSPKKTAFERECGDRVDIRSTDLFEIESLNGHRVDLIYFHPRFNDIKHINRHLKLLNEKLQQHGLLVCHCETYEQRLQRHLNKFGFRAKLIQPFDFLFYRVLPKINRFKKLFLFLSKGRNRVLSRAEILGRLHYCGFEIAKLEDMDNELHLIMKKVKKPYQDPEPSSGILYRKKSMGVGGKMVYVYKLRTMHPYSEYLRSYIKHENGYALSGNGIGKIVDDFRVTIYGQFLRKYWIDELPQLLNWLRGDLKLVGLRPLGNSILEECPADMQEARKQYKSGIIPPFYYDMPQSIDEVYESERRYIAAYKQHPIRTDFRYFFKAMYNILLHGARSS